jgi:phosphoribosylamine--glycine ligase
MKDVIEPTIKGMADEGHPFTGFLYAGVMIDAKGDAKVLEYNVRFGDPETQPVMMRLQSDLVDLIESALDGDLNNASIDWDVRSSVGVVMAAGGYPDAYEKDKKITGLFEESESSKVFHAGTLNKNGDVVTSGGRVLCVVGLGDNVTEAQKIAYESVKKVNWEGAFYRTDIAYRAVNRERS